MLKNPILVCSLLLLAFTRNVHAQYAKSDSTFKKNFAGSTFFLLGNFAKNNSPDFVQLNYGRRLNHNNTLSVELKTWKYAWPLGIPYGDSFENPAEKFPGYIREFGFAVAYQHFWWKGLYSGIHIMNAWQDFRTDSREKVGNGFQIFNTYRLGYHFKLAKDRFFIEPSVAITHRPLHTEMPASFKNLDDRWPNYFIGEPGLHFGINF